MSTKVAVNGFGRIGRLVSQIILKSHSQDLELVAVNDLAPTKTMAHLFEYDSVYGKYTGQVKAEENAIIVDGQEIKVFHEKDPKALPWKDLGVEVVIESTGVFRTYEQAHWHIEAGAKKVILSAPGKEDGREIPIFVPGVNLNKLTAEMDVVSMASCTTNCLAPILKILNEKIGIENSLMTTVHSYTNDQSLVDSENKDLRRARAAALSMIPTTTGAATSAAKTVEGMEGKIDGMAIRVPTPTVSIVDLTAILSREVSVEEINQLFKAAEKGELAGILGTCDEPLVSIDYRQDPRSSIVDLPLTQVSKNLVKVFSWYDNEWGYSSRLAEFTVIVAKK
ncbi:MAG: type I glyceraldehyde-3-phosphate dehydrogenase [Patescibacteria group bacterium]